MRLTLSRRSAVGRALRAPLDRIPKNRFLPVLQGPMRGAKWMVGAGPHGCWLGCYEYRQTRKLARVLREGMVFYDVGANAGYYTLLASRRVGPAGLVVAVEPVPANLERLHAHLHVLRATNVKVVAAALSSNQTIAQFRTLSGSYQGRLDPDGDLQVRCITLDSLVEETRRPPQVMKIDVEGGEWAVLMGGVRTLKRWHPTIFLSTHGSQVHARCLDLLREIGYTVEVMAPSQLLATPLP